MRLQGSPDGLCRRFGLFAHAPPVNVGCDQFLQVIAGQRFVGIADRLVGASLRPARGGGGRTGRRAFL